MYNLKLMQHIHRHKLQDSYARTLSIEYGCRNFACKIKKRCTNYGKRVIQLLIIHEWNIDLTLKTKPLKSHGKSFLLSTDAIVDPQALTCNSTSILSFFAVYFSCY